MKKHKILYFSFMGYLNTVNWKREIKATFLIFVLGGATVYFSCGDCFDRLNVAIVAYIASGLLWVLLWQGNGTISDYLTYKMPWLENPAKRLAYGVVVVVIYTPLAVLSLFFALNQLFNVSLDGIEITLGISVLITFFISFFLNSKEFLKNWKKAALDAEKLKKEQMATKYESLKNQVNPHFLFNSLNALTNLVYEDQDLAAKFIRELSKVYRYILDTRSQELVTLKTEMDFVEAYVFLQKIRFDDKLQISIDVAGFEKKTVPPVAIQTLIENAIKHNIIAEEEPLHIEIAVDEFEMLIVKNNLQKKNIPLEESAGMGLANIKARYEFLSQKPMEIIDGPSAFIVKLPLLDFEQ
uniref:sensor histidine kinase n=1 Tax=Roseivirga sp. TaxID=1964215 RepID=UPI0040470BF7